MPKEFIVYALLFVLGILYNRLVVYVKMQLPDQHGVTAWMVVVGVLLALTFGVLPIYGRSIYFGILMIFTPIGLPMVFGSMDRWLRSRDPNRIRKF